MPYINKNRAVALASKATKISSSGELNYLISRLMSNYILQQGINYATIAQAISAAQDAADECKRRILAPYEDFKKDQISSVDPYEVLGNEIKKLTKK